MSGYFEEQINSGKPIVPPVQTSPEPPPPSLSTADVIVPSNEFKGLPVRASGDRIFLIKGGKKYWVTSPEAYTKLGFKFGDEVRIDQETLSVLEEGEPLR